MSTKASSISPLPPGEGEAGKCKALLCAAERGYKDVCPGLSGGAEKRSLKGAKRRVREHSSPYPHPFPLSHRARGIEDGVIRSGIIIVLLIVVAVIVLFLLPTSKPGQIAVAATATQTAADAHRLSASADLSTPVVVSAAPPAPAAATTEAVAPAGTVMIGDFEGKTTPNKHYGTLVLSRGHEFGWGWSTTTDQVAGGHSVASIAIIHPGTDDTHAALRVTGEVKPGFQYGPWAGAIWFPGHEPMQPADLSAKKELTFWARGTLGSHNVMLASGSPNGIPLYASFVITKQWKEYHMPLATSFPNADWKQVYYLAFAAGTNGKFRFDLDQVTIQ